MKYYCNTYQASLVLDTKRLYYGKTFSTYFVSNIYGGILFYFYDGNLVC